MLSIEEIKKNYNEDLHKFDKGLFREYLQYLILSLIFKHSDSKKLSFFGGTNLRIVHGIKRFSEDIDFDNKGLSFNEFENIADYLKDEIEKLGFIVEIQVFRRMAFHLYLKIPDALFELGISPLKKEKILIQLDTFDQGFFYNPEVFILDKFEFFDQILVTPKSIILSQKLWTITQRRRPKGRDFYDIMFLMQTTTPDINFLESKFKTPNLKKIVEKILEITETFNFDEIAKDVEPFLFSQTDSEKIKLFNQFLKQKFIDF